MPNIELKIIIAPNGNMVLTANAELRKVLKERLDSGEDEGRIEGDILQMVTELSNNEYDYCRPEWAGALTSAPMLATFGPEQELPAGVSADFVKVTSHSKGVTRFEPVEKCWGYMDYAVRMITDDLISDGKAVFQSGQ